MFLPDKTLNKDEREREIEKNGYFCSCVNLIKQGFPMNQTSLWLEKKPIYTLECLRQLQLVNHLLEEIIYKSKSHTHTHTPPSRRLFKFDLHLKSGGCTVIVSLESFETN